MSSILDNIRALFPFFLGSWAFFILFTLWRPQRFANSFLLMLALMGTLMFVAGLFGDWSAQALIVLFLLVVLAIFLVPVMLITNGVTMTKREGRSLSNLLSLLLGIIIGAGEIAAVIVAFSSVDMLSVGTSRSILTFLFLTVFYFSVWILAFVLYIFVIQYIPHRKKFDYVIIHGCGLLEGRRVSKLLSNRLDKAVELYQKSAYKPTLIPSGGKGPDEDISEAEAMKQYLLEHGIPREHILPEDTSMTTMENLINSKALMTRDGEKQRVALVTSNYHVYRCLLYAKKLKLKCTGIGASVAWYFWPSATLREFTAVFTRWPRALFLFGGYMICVILPMIWVYYN